MIPVLTFRLTADGSWLWLFALQPPVSAQQSAEVFPFWRVCKGSCISGIIKLENRRTNFREIWYWEVSHTFVDICQFWSQLHLLTDVSLKTYVGFCAHLERRSLITSRSEQFEQKLQGKTKHSLYTQYPFNVSLTCLGIFNHKFWQELIANFSWILHGPHRKSLQQFFAAAGTCLPSRCLAAIEGYADPQTLLWYETDRIENDTSISCSIVAAGTYLPSRCLATIGGIHTYTDWWEGFTK
jgi:hypothetical protein